MDVEYNKGTERCIVLMQDDRLASVSVADAKLLIVKLERTIERAEVDRDRELMTPVEEALDDIIREAIKNDYANQYVGDRMIELNQWGKRIKNVMSNETKVEVCR